MKNNYKLNIIYDGSSFFGWQVQKSERTVQGEIEKELKNIFKTDKINLIGRLLSFTLIQKWIQSK